MHRQKMAAVHSSSVNCQRVSIYEYAKEVFPSKKRARNNFYFNVC